MGSFPLSFALRNRFYYSYSIPCPHCVEDVLWEDNFKKNAEITETMRSHIWL